MIVTLVSFLLVIGICVISHEGGHFLAAKWRNVYVHEFSFGMGFLLASKQSVETKYSIRAFPVGGYVKLEGEDEDAENIRSDIPRERALYAKKPWERLLILAGGIFVNLVLAWLLFSGYLFANGVFDVQSATVRNIMLNTPAAEIQLRSGDVIKSINGIEINAWADISKTLAVIKTDKISLVYLRGTELCKADVFVPYNRQQGRRLLGIQPVKIRFSVLRSMREALKYSFNMSYEIVMSISRIILGKSKDEISGPLGIAVMSGEAAKQGFWTFIMFLGVINLNLGLVNLLPFPALDGGRIVFTLVEMLTGRKVSPRFEAAVHYAGFILLLLLIVYVTGLDIIRLIK